MLLLFLLTMRKLEVTTTHALVMLELDRKKEDIEVKVKDFRDEKRISVSLRRVDTVSGITPRVNVKKCMQMLWKRSDIEKQSWLIEIGILDMVQELVFLDFAEVGHQEGIVDHHMAEDTVHLFVVLVKMIEVMVEVSAVDTVVEEWDSIVFSVVISRPILSTQSLLMKDQVEHHLSSRASIWEI